jgi:hypothetical protein
MRITGAVNVVEREEAPRSPSPQWDLSFRRKCRARNLIGYDGNHRMLQCEKLLNLGLAERRDALQKSGLCMFCLKHSAELECYGKGGLSKPRCTRTGCDGEHTPNVHMLMGEDNARVNLIAEGEDGGETEGECEAEGEYEWEYKDGGWWVGTVGVVEAPGWAGEASGTTDGSTLNQEEVKDDNWVERGSEFQVNEYPEEEMTEDECWDLEPGCLGLEEEGAEVPQDGRAQHPLHGLIRSARPATAGQQKLRKRPKMTADQQWEEARRSPRLRQLLSDDLSSEDEDEERYGRFAESGRWVSKLYGLPQYPTMTSGGECSG